jgi:hypothetical protein
MKRKVAEILKDALALPTEVRAALAASLLDSLDPHVDEDAEAAWVTESNRRVADLESGTVRTISLARSAAPALLAGTASGPQTIGRGLGSPVGARLTRRPAPSLETASGQA